MPNLELTDEEQAALLRLVSRRSLPTVIRCPPGSILEKLEPPTSRERSKSVVMTMGNPYVYRFAIIPVSGYNPEEGRS
jgi:hypothetical protein